MAQVLACGAEIKNTFCLTRDEYAFVSQHIGDMENLETLEHYERTIELYKRLFRIEPEIVAHDLHPDYMATRYAREQLGVLGLQPAAVQHHHAHLAACLADNGWTAGDGPAIGAIMDGTGYGADGRIWGGDWLVGDYGGYRRAAHLEYLPLPGGDAATRSPWRIAVGYLVALLGRVPDLAVPDGIGDAQVALLRQQVDQRLNCPLTSSMGRLFDAVSALLGVCTQATYEAQAAIELEAVADREPEDTPCEAYPFEVERTGEGLVVRIREMLAALVDDRAHGVPVAEMAWRFHHTVAEMIVHICQTIAQETGLHTVALSGGCYQNRILLRLAVPALQSAGLNVLLHRQVPCNDGGLSLGQATIADFTSRHAQS